MKWYLVNDKYYLIKENALEASGKDESKITIKDVDFTKIEDCEDYIEWFTGKKKVDDKLSKDINKS